MKIYVTHHRVDTPFGRFAANMRPIGDGQSVINLEPMGELDEVPLDARGSLDYAALEAEAERIHGKRPMLITPNEFIVNRKSYSGTLEVRYVDPAWDRTRRVAYVTHYAGLQSDEITDSAREKIAAYMLEHEHEILTPERMLDGERNRLQNRAERARQQVLDLEEQLEAARTELNEILDTLRKPVTS